MTEEVRWQNKKYFWKKDGLAGKIIFSDATDFQLSKRNKKETITLEQGFNSSISLPNATKNTVSFFTKPFSCNV